jgi:dTDP-4-amino-4,6-dideoxygalactose transaminase
VRGGVNSRLDEMQAAVLRVKLLTLNDHLVQRRVLAAQYRSLLGEFAPPVRAESEHAWHQFVVRSPRRDEFMRATAPANIAVHYPVPLHQQPAFACKMSLPESERAAREVMSLPLHPCLDPAAVQSLMAQILHALRVSS